MWFNFISGQTEYNFVFGVDKKAVALKLLTPESVLSLSMFLMAPMITGSNHYCMRYVGGRNPLRNELPFFLSLQSGPEDARAQSAQRSTLPPCMQINTP